MMVLEHRDVSHIDRALLDSNGRMKALFPCADFQLNFSWETMLYWCHQKARYILPTLELVMFLREIIGDKFAIEIGSGNGDLGYMLGIPETDSYMQTEAAISALYRLGRQVPTSPPPSVAKMDANFAVQHLRPEVVVGAWITQKHRQGETKGNMFGVEEEKILDQGCTYIHVGNTVVHGDKRIRSRKHEVYRIPGHISRAQNPTENVIYVWKP